MNFTEILSYEIVDYKFFEIDLEALLLSLLMLFLAALLSFLVTRLFNRPSVKKFYSQGSSNRMIFSLKTIFWLLALVFIVDFSTDKFLDFEILDNRYFYFTLFHFFLLLLLINLNLLVVYTLRIVARRIAANKQESDELISKTFGFTRLILWVVVLYSMFRVVAVRPEKTIDFEFFTINDVEITIGDFAFAGIVIFFGYLSLMLVKRFFKIQVKYKKIDLGTSDAIFRILKYIVWVIMIAIILESSGFELSILLAGSAALLVGLGFGIQQIFSDFVSGIMMIIEGTLKVGDVVETDNIVGRVVASNLRTTTVLTRDNIRLIVPNSHFTQNTLVNWSNTETKTRFHVDVGVAYGSDLKLVTKLLEEAAAENKFVLKKPKPLAIFHQFGESSLDFKIYFWTDKSFEVIPIQSDIRLRIDQKFRANDVTIPFPQRDLHFKTPPPAYTDNTDNTDNPQP